MQSDELVSICILCYNHERFISKTIESIVAQQTSFEVKIYINDDCSSDRSVEIVKALQQTYPDKIILFENEANKGQLAGAENLLNHARGRYLSLMDGDDYWSYDGKLQKQVDFLEANMDYIASCHDASIERHDLQQQEIASLQTKGFYRFISQFTKYGSDQIHAAELLRGQTYIQNSTLLWRRFDPAVYIDAVRKARYNLDWYIGVILVSRGKIQYINEAWSVYSDHAGGRTKNNYFHSYLPDKIRLLKTLFKMDYYNKPYFRYLLYELIAKEYYGLIMMKSASPKPVGYILRCMMNYIRYNLVSTFSFGLYVFKYRKQFNS